MRASYGSVLIPLFEEDGLRMGEIAARSRLSKQTMTTLVRLTERVGLTARRPDERDARATRVYLSGRAKQFQPAAERVLAQLDRLVVEVLGERRMRMLGRDLAAVADVGGFSVPSIRSAS